MSLTYTGFYGFEGSAQIFNPLLSALLCLVEATPLVVFIFLKMALQGLFGENRGKRRSFGGFESFEVNCWGFYGGKGPAQKAAELWQSN